MDTEKLGNIAMLVCDVDGVLTDGMIVYGTDNMEIKAFHVRDGLAMKLAWVHHFPIVLLTGRNSDALARRAGELNARVYQGVRDKGAGLIAMAEEYGIPLEKIAYVGDDLNDLPAMQLAGLPIAVADATQEVLATAAYVTNAAGGQAAIREVIELIFRAQGRWDDAVQTYLDHLRGTSHASGSAVH
jgi:3-deoxy-D-manno-octulosonate 8-phosphate phosphatase (KDO 8-P phosphatase)